MIEISEFPFDVRGFAVPRREHGGVFVDEYILVYSVADLRWESVKFRDVLRTCRILQVLSARQYGAIEDGDTYGKFVDFDGVLSVSSAACCPRLTTVCCPHWFMTQAGKLLLSR